MWVADDPLQEVTGDQGAILPTLSVAQAGRAGAQSQDLATVNQLQREELADQGLFLASGCRVEGASHAVAMEYAKALVLSQEACLFAPVPLYPGVLALDLPGKGGMNLWHGPLEALQVLAEQGADAIGRAAGTAALALVPGWPEDSQPQGALARLAATGLGHLDARSYPETCGFE